MQSTEEIIQAGMIQIKALNLATFTEYQARLTTILSETMIAAIRNEGEKPVGKK